MSEHSKFEEYIDRTISRNTTINRFLFSFTAIALIIGVFSLFSRQKELIHENKQLKTANDSISGRPVKVDTVVINRKVNGKTRIDTIVKYAQSAPVIVHDTVRVVQSSDSKQEAYNRVINALSNQVNAINQKYNSLQDQYSYISAINQHLSKENDSLATALAACLGRKVPPQKKGVLIKTTYNPKSKILNTQPQSADIK